MNLRRLPASLTASALAASMLSACNDASSLMPSSTVGTLENQQLPPQVHELLRHQLSRKIKHVFMIFQENHSFDNYFGTYPGAENLRTRLARTHGYSQWDPSPTRCKPSSRSPSPTCSGPIKIATSYETRFNGGQDE